jgi:hypothetical protein
MWREWFAIEVVPTLWQRRRTLRLGLPDVGRKLPMQINLQPGETKIDTWSLFYLPPNGNKYNGKLTVTNQRLLYDAMFDASIKGLLAEAVFVKWGSEGYLEIDKRDIQSVNVVKKLFSKSCTVTLMDGSRHTFDYGAMNIDKVVGAIEAR